MTLEDMASGQRQPPSLGTNARSVADSLGMPRESVRRRVQSLIAAGLVVRCGNELMLSAEGLAALAPVRNFLVGLSVRYFDIVSSVIAGARQDASRESQLRLETRSYQNDEGEGSSLGARPFR